MLGDHCTTQKEEGGRKGKERVRERKRKDGNTVKFENGEGKMSWREGEDA